MSKEHPHSLHSGELYIQKERLTPVEITEQLPDYIDTDMPQQHLDFYPQLSYLPLTTLDGHGRPWVSLLVTKSKSNTSVGIKTIENNRLAIVAQTNPFDPFLLALKQKSIFKDENRYFAGVGIDFSNRRRNKLAGKITTFNVDSDKNLNLTLASDEHLGNCPKYITIRSLEPYVRKAELILNNYDSTQIHLSSLCKEHIDQASTVFLGTRRIKDSKKSENGKDKMGLNHRGGAPGFIRVYEEINTESDDKLITTYLVLPDFSGNRFYQSLGNIHSDELVGMVFPNFNNGDMLYITGKAKNLFDDEARNLMPRTNQITRIQVTGAVFVKQGLDLRMLSNEKYSPYNPPLRYLRQELEQLGHASQQNEAFDTTVDAKLVSTKILTNSITTFKFQLSKPIDATLPGGFGIFDFSDILDSGYAHMNEENPQAVNEDYVRTWTLSSAANFNFKEKQFEQLDHVEITVKRKPGGLISNFLHTNKEPLEINLKGTGSGFSCFSQNSPKASISIPPKMLWIAGGVGITPFMSMWNGILEINESDPSEQNSLVTDIVLLFSGKEDDLDVLRHFLSTAHSVSKHISIRILAFQSSINNRAINHAILDTLTHNYPNTLLSVEQRRFHKNDLKLIDSLSSREVFLCGPDSLMKYSQESLRQLYGERLKIYQESYLF